MNDSTVFDKLQTIVDDQGVSDALQFLIEHFRETKHPHQLFEALKMKVRLELGLPLLYGQVPDNLDDDCQRALEEGLLDACREVGTELIRSGQIREGWMYLQPLGDRQLIKQLFAELVVDESNLDDVIEIGLSQGADPELGYRLVLKEFGTCNAITTFDTQVVQFERPVQRKLAAQLINHVYAELVGNVKNHIAEKEGDSELSDHLRELISTRDWLTAAGGHHIDTTHLASLMRIGRCVEQPAELQKMVELAEYGQRLDADFHYAGGPPFENTYADHLVFYRALTGTDVDDAIEHFHQKIESTDEAQFGTIAIECLIDLLHRLGRSDEALQLATDS